MVAVLVARQAATAGLPEQSHAVLAEITNGTVGVVPSETGCEDLSYSTERCR